MPLYVVSIDFNAHKIKSQDRALASLAVLAGKNKVLSKNMLNAALKVRFEGKVAEAAFSLTDKVTAGIDTLEMSVSQNDLGLR